MSLALDLTLDDYNDEDLSDILQDNELHLHSYANDSFKVAKRRAAGRRGKRATSESLISSTKCVQRQKSTSDLRCATSRRPRPTTLKFFAEPARPGPLILPLCNVNEDTSEHRNPAGRDKNEETAREGCVRVESRLKESYSEETIKNNNALPAAETELHGTDKASGSDITGTASPLQQQKLDMSSEPKYRSNVYKRTNHTSEHRMTSQSIAFKSSHQQRYVGLTRSASEWSIEDPDRTEYCYVDGEMKEQTHFASFKFVPRHADEISLEINDPLHVYDQADDFWYEGINMRTGEKGIFPAYYAQSLFDDMDEISEYSVKDETSEQFKLYFLGSAEVSFHKGNDILCQAMHKVAQTRRTTLHQQPPAYVCLFVNSHGVKMVDQTQMKHIKKSVDPKQVRGFSSSSQVKERTHFFQLRNVSFCGHHPRNDKYFAFITRHPNFAARFACHVFVSETSTRPLAECVGRAFDMFYRESMEYSHPVEDIYIE